MKVIGLFLALFLATYANITAQSETEWQQLSVENMEIDHPSDWRVDQSGQMGTSFFLFSPQSNLADDFQENVNVIVQDLSAYGSLTLDEYVEASLGQIKNIITNASIIVNERVVDGDKEYQKLIYTGTQASYSLKFEQFCYLIDNKAYIVTLTCKESEFDKYQELGEKILSSFIIK